MRWVREGEKLHVKKNVIRVTRDEGEETVEPYEIKGVESAGPRIL